MGQDLMTIRAIARSTVERIASGQVIVDLSSAIKELIENSIDAFATSIEITFVEEGLEGFEVVDNGSGMGEEDLKTLGQPHCTSKLESFEAIDELTSLGFRGEAFHSLCALSQSVRVTTRTESAGHGLAAEYGAGGKLANLKPCAASKGTRIRVTGLFHEYAVRLGDWKKNSKKIIAKALKIIQGYAIGFPAIKFRCIGVEKGRQQALIATSGDGSMATVFSELFGLHSKHLLAITKQQDETSIEALVGRSDAPRRSSPDRQFFFINGHPSDQRLIQKAANEAYREYGISDYPVLAVSIKLGAGACDLNLTPDKRTITVFQEKEIAAILLGLIKEGVFARLDLTPKIENYSQTTLRTVTQASSQTLSLEESSQCCSHQTRDETQETASDAALPALAKVPENVSEDKPSLALERLAEPVSDRLSKKDFLEMQILGQFNCGFILARLDRPETNTSNMYIIDQHAADERFRLETLERIEKINIQQLVKPFKFSASMDDSIFISNNLDVLEKLGFKIRSEASSDSSGSFELLAVPQIASVTLEVKDLLDVIHQLRENPTLSGNHALACCDRVNAALASKACRSAIMIGAPLSDSQMFTVVRNLANLEKPWICAHGRPTVRLLYSTDLS